MGVSVDVTFKSSGKGRKKKYTENERRQRKEASRLASKLNKRLARLQRNKGKIYSDALDKWEKDGAVKFSVAGKSKKELQQEMARMRHFNNLETSTIKGARKVLVKTANLVGITTWENYEQLNATMSEFFKLTSKIEEYMKNDKRFGVAIGYEKIWEYIANNVEQTEEGLRMAQMDMKELAEHMGQAILNQKAGEGVGRLEDLFK